MRVNVYAEEITDRVELVTKENDEGSWVGVRFYLELPVTKPDGRGGHFHYSGPFLHRDGDDDSSAVTFWGKRKLREALVRAIELIDQHYEERERGQENG